MRLVPGTQLVCLLLFHSPGVDAKFSWGKGGPEVGGTPKQINFNAKSNLIDTASDVNDYYDEDEDEGISGKILKLGGAAVLFSGGVGAAVRWVVPRLKTGNTWTRGTRPMLDEGPIPLEAAPEFRKDGAAPAAASATATQAPPAATVAALQVPSAAAPAAASASASATTPKPTGYSAVLGPSLLRVSNGTERLESVDTAEALDGNVVVLYMSSLEVEQEFLRSNMTRSLLALHVEATRLTAESGGHKDLKVGELIILALGWGVGA